MAALAVIGLVASLATVQLRRLVDFGIRPQPPTFLEYAAIIAAIGLFLSIALTLAMWITVRRRRKQDAISPGGGIERGVMVLGALQLAAFLILAYALIVARFERQSSETVTIAENPLGYLPTRCRIVCDFDFSALRKEPVGKELLGLFDQNAKVLGLGSFSKWTGLPADAIDRVATGVLQNGSTTRVCIVIRTSKPYSFSRVRKSIGKENEIIRRPQPVFRIHYPSNLEALVWCRSGRLLVIDLGTSPARPEYLGEYVVHKGAEGFPPVVSRGLLELASIRGTAIRIAGKPPSSLGADQIRSLVASIQAHGQEAVANFSVGFADAEAARSGTSTLRKRIEAAGGVVRFFEGRERSTAILSGEARLSAEAMRAVFRNEVLPLLRRILAFE